MPNLSITDKSHNNVVSAPLAHHGHGRDQAEKLAHPIQQHDYF